MRLWVRLGGVTAAVAIGLVAVTGLAAVRIATDQAAADSRAILGRDAGMLATFVGTWTDDQVHALEGWLKVWDPERTAHPDGLQRAVHLAIPSLVTVALVDAAGVPAVEPVFLAGEVPGRVAGTPEGVEQLLSRLPVGEALAAPGRAAMGAPYLPPGSDTPSLPVAVAREGSRHLLGAEVSLALLAETVAEQAGPERGAAVVDGGGRPFLGGGHPLVDAERLRPILRTDASVDMTLGGGRSVTGAVAAVPTTDWTVVVVEPAEVAARAGRDIRDRTVQVVLGAALLALAVGAVTARSLAEPVARMRETANAVAEGDYGRRVDVHRGDELGDLARAFNHMSVRLRASRDEIRAQQEEIEAFNRELQARVEERTRELEEAHERLVQSGQLAAVAQVGASLAHELNNPLAGILGLAQLLRSRRGEDEDARLLARLEEQAARCRDVVAAMLRFSAGEVDPVEAPVVDLAEVLRDVLGLVGGPFRQRGVALELREPVESLRVRVDPGHASRILAQVLTTLGAGLDAGARIRVSLENAGGTPSVRLVPDRPVAVGAAHDDWMASGMGLWVAHQMLARAGGRLQEPGGGEVAWRIQLPGA